MSKRYNANIPQTPKYKRFNDNEPYFKYNDSLNRSTSSTLYESAYSNNASSGIFPNNTYKSFNDSIPTVKITDSTTFMSKRRRNERLMRCCTIL